MTPQNPNTPSKAERNSAARERARQIREAQQKKEQRTKMLTIWGVVLAVVAIIVVVALVVVNSMKADVPDAGPAPQYGNEHGGVTLIKDGFEETPDVTVDLTSLPAQGDVEEGTLPPGIEAAPDGEPAQIVIYVDLGCPACKQFELAYEDYLTELVDSGKATVEYRVVNFLDRVSSTNYSSRSANAALCVSDSQPEKYTDYVTALFENQPDEGGAGLDNDTLVSIAKGAGVDTSALEDCMKDDTYRPYVNYANGVFNVYGVGGTPGVYVQGVKYNSQEDGDFQAYADAVISGEKPKK